VAGSPRKRERKTRWQLLMDDPATLRAIFDHVAEGGTVRSWSLREGVRPADVRAWLAGDDKRKQLLADAESARHDYLHDGVVEKLRALTEADLAEAFYASGKKKGKLKPLHEMPPVLRAAIAAIKPDEIKVVAPDRAVELMGKYLRLFVERHEHTGKVTLEDLVGGSMAPPEASAAPRE